jgi:arabinose-5-phosphate isomerase
MLRSALERRGVVFTGQTRTVDAQGRADGRQPLQVSSLVEIAARKSPPLSVIAAQVLKPSQNLYAELLLRTLAANPQTKSTLAQASDVALDCRVSEEACPLNLVPTASTTAALALGDALAMTLLVAKGFKQEDFATLHPGGKLGKKLMRVEQMMHAGDQTPTVRLDTPMRNVADEMTRKGLGMSCVVDESNHLLGIVTDGDVRRHMLNGTNIESRRASDIMTRRPITISRQTLATEALHILEQRKITSIVVVDPANVVQGVVHLHDLWRTQMI